MSRFKLPGNRQSTICCTVMAHKRKIFQLNFIRNQIGRFSINGWQLKCGDNLTDILQFFHKRFIPFGCKHIVSCLHPVFTCLLPFSTSLSSVYEIPISAANCLWDIFLYSSSSFSTSPGCVGRKGSRLFAIIFGFIPLMEVIISCLFIMSILVIDPHRGQSLFISFQFLVIQ